MELDVMAFGEMTLDEIVGHNDIGRNCDGPNDIGLKFDKLSLGKIL